MYGGYYGGYSMFGSSASVEMPDEEIAKMGALKVSVDGVLGYVCPLGWLEDPEQKNANVACKELGYTKGLAGSYEFSTPVEHVVQAMTCEPDATGLGQCVFITSGMPCETNAVVQLFCVEEDLAEPRPNKPSWSQYLRQYYYLQDLLTRLGWMNMYGGDYYSGWTQLECIQCTSSQPEWQCQNDCKIYPWETESCMESMESGGWEGCSYSDYWEPM